MFSRENYNVQQYKKAEYKNIDLITSLPDLVIVDINSKNIMRVPVVIKELDTLFRHIPEQIPPIIALVEDVCWQNPKLFDICAFDYISYPFKKDEFKFRLQQALRSRESIPTFDKNTSNNLPINPDLLLLNKTVDYLKAHLNEDIKLKELVLKVGTNKNKLYQIFKEYLGIPVFSWLHEHRMRVAAGLLENTSQSVTFIGMQVGYREPNNFSAAFKRVFNVSPKQYKQEISQKGNLA